MCGEQVAKYKGIRGSVQALLRQYQECSHLSTIVTQSGGRSAAPLRPLMLSKSPTTALLDSLEGVSELYMVKLTSAGIKLRVCGSQGV